MPIPLQFCSAQSRDENGFLLADARSNLPFTLLLQIKESGFGREGSTYGINEYCVQKLIAISIL